MSRPDLETALVPVPEVPPTHRLAWLLFMQPEKLDHMFTAWGLRNDISLWSLRRGWQARSPHIRRMVPRLLSISLVWAPLAATSITFLSDVQPLQLYLVGFAIAITLSHTTGMVPPPARVVLYGVNTLSLPAIIYYIGSAESGYSNDTPMTLGLIAALVFGTTINISDTGGGIKKHSFSVYYFVIAGLVIALGGLLVPASGTATLVALGLGISVSTARLHFYLFETLIVMRIAHLARDPDRGPAATRWLPYRHHELIYFPLPRLRQVFIDLAQHSPNLARQLIDEASTTIAQKSPARQAFDELQAAALRQAAETGAWLRVIELNGSFFPAKDGLPPDDPLHKFIAAATDLHAVENGGSQHRRRNLLERSGKQIDDLKKVYLAALTHDGRTTLLYAVAGVWSRAIATKREALTREIERDPEIPNVFVVGPPLNPGDPDAVQLFRARRDLITIIERDLDDTQRGVIFLVGQRRMGKTSLLAMLPSYLGTTTTIATCNFQWLSGSEHRGTPHRWIVAELARALSPVAGLALPEPLLTDAWGTALSWLIAVDTELTRVDHRALVAIDEVEGLQLGMNEGWGDLTFLDFVRAAGDRLQRIRLLLVSAHPLASPKLGPAWVDRLISVMPRTLGPLAPEDAEALLCRPIPRFPADVFGEDIARTLLAHTGCHPFLIQAVGSEVVQRLLRDRRRTATVDDVERALDGAVKIAEGALFTYLWDSFDFAEKAIMRTLADGVAVDSETGTFRVLREQWFVDVKDGEPVVAFPLFARWIRDYRAERPKRPETHNDSTSRSTLM